MSIRTSVAPADVTVSPVDIDLYVPAIVSAALIVVLPIATGVASPFEPTVLLMVATALFEDLQVAWEVRSWVVVSENVPVAVY
jgi:hypothetical protein